MKLEKTIKLIKNNKAMKLKESIEILKHHQAWRRGAEIEMIDPVDIGLAIDMIILEIEKQQKSS